MSAGRRGTPAAFQAWRVTPHADWAKAQEQPEAGRWHYAGARVVYASRTPELAILEALAHHSPGMGPYLLCIVEGLLHLAPRRVHRAELPADRRRRTAITRGIGREWLASRHSEVLWVPSAVCVHACNALINPRLAEQSQWRLVELERFRFDRRLVARRA